MDPSLQNRLSKINLLFLDNDGVMTDGKIVYGDHGDELKYFDVQDGFGIVLARRLGIRTVVVSGKSSRVNKRRAKDLGIEKFYERISDKLAVFEKLLKKYNLKPEEICCIGDDWLDIAPMRRAGVAVAVPNAVSEVRAVAQWVTSRTGGSGAVREVIDAILKAKGLYDDAVKLYDR